MTLSIEEIQNKVIPIAEKYHLKSVYLFGSYARNEATEESDVDLLIDRTGSTIKGLLDLSGLNSELSSELGKEVDLITTHMLEQKNTVERSPFFINNIFEEGIKIYG